MRAQKTLTALIAWGALWGMAEATVGHLLHLCALPYGWLFWFPLAFFFMHRVYRQIESPAAVLGAAAIAAALKCVDLLAPYRLDFVINPAVSIILEALAVGAAFGALTRAGRQLGPGMEAALFLAMAWRGLYLLYALLLMPAAWRQISPVASVDRLLNFMLRESAANAVFIWLYLHLPAAREERLAAANPKLAFLQHPAVASLLLLAAVFIQWRF